MTLRLEFKIKRFYNNYGVSMYDKEFIETLPLWYFQQ